MKRKKPATRIKTPKVYLKPGHNLKRVSVVKLRDCLADVINRAGYTGERIILTRHDKPVAAIVPVDDAEFMERYEDEYWGRAAQESLDEMERTGAKPIPWEQVKRELDEKRARRMRRKAG